MIIVRTFNSLADAARSFGNYDKFTNEGWDFIESLEESFRNSDEILYYNADIEFCYTEQKLKDAVDFSKFGEDITEGEVLSWLYENDYILGSYKVSRYEKVKDDSTDKVKIYKEVKETYVMSRHDSSDINMDDMPEHFFQKEISLEEYLGCDIEGVNKEILENLLEENGAGDILNFFIEDNEVIVDSRKWDGEPVFENKAGLIKIINDLSCHE